EVDLGPHVRADLRERDVRGDALFAAFHLDHAGAVRRVDRAVAGQATEINLEIETLVLESRDRVRECDGGCDRWPGWRSGPVGRAGRARGHGKAHGGDCAEPDGRDSTMLH